jgi:hypothetical protein
MLRSVLLAARPRRRLLCQRRPQPIQGALALAPNSHPRLAPPPFRRRRAGTHADAEGIGRVLGLVTTVAGMLVFALMIGVVSDTIGARVDDLKRGSAKVRPSAEARARFPRHTAVGAGGG